MGIEHGDACSHGGVVTNPVLTLASASPARRRLLQQAAIPHRVRVSGLDESTIAHSDPVQLVQRLAAAKAEAVAAAAGAGPVLGCDSLLVFDGDVFGKPQTAADAEARWHRMAGRWGDLLTGHCLWRSGQVARIATVRTRVLFALLTKEEIAAYVATGEPLECAGGFALEGRGGLLVERIDGCFSNVIGLSLPLLRRWLSEGGSEADR